MLNEDRVRAALRAEAATAEQLPAHLWPIIIAKARRQGPRGWWGRLQLLPKTGLAIVTTVLMMGAIGYIVVPPQDQTPRKLPAVQVASIPQMGEQLGFRLKLPAYLPPGVELYESRLEADGVDSTASMKIAALYYMTPSGEGGITIKQWRSDRPAVTPPADTRAEGFQGSPKRVPLSGRHVYVAEGNLSGQRVYGVYWHDNGVNYSVVGVVAKDELLQVAESLN